MPSIRLANVFSLSLAMAVPSGTAFAQDYLQSPSASDPQPVPGSDPKLKGLPTFLLPVPAGKVTIGLTAEQLVEAACETTFPSRPEIALKTSASKVERAVKRSSSTLGRTVVDVDAFLLARWPVKNSEYELFVRHSRDPKVQMKAIRPPFHWWRYGRQDDYDKRLPEINQRFPGNDEGPVLYWHQEGPELPYKLVDEKGNSIADYPVSYVSYLEANEFAGYLGMRLPTEVEWTRAARGDRDIVWPWGDPQDPDSDHYVGDENLKWLQLYGYKGQRAKPVGTVANAKGPFGHLDVFGCFWQLVTGPGWRPVNGEEEFSAQWQALQKSKAGALLKAPPMWRNDRVVAKGGSYLSAQDPIQLLIDQRAPLQPVDVLESVGFRLAKSLRPGFDTLYSRLRGVFNRARFVPEQNIDLAGQVGAERYELAANGFPTAYHTVSFAPANWLSKNKKASLKKLLEASHGSPLVLGALVTTEPIANAELHETLFTVLYRSKGMPKELEAAIKRGYKQVQAELKAAARAKKAGKTKKKDDKKAKKDDWSGILRKYGLGRKDLEPKGSDHLDYIRIDGIKIETRRAAFLLHDNDGKVVAAIPAPNAQPKSAKPFRSELQLVAGEETKAVARFHFGVVLTRERQDRVVDFHFDLPLDSEPPSAEKPWRLPE